VSPSARGRARLAARAAAAELGVVAAFQVAVAAGAPWGAWTQGGGTDGVLPPGRRGVAAGSAVLVLALAAGLLARVGEGPLRSAPPRVVDRLAQVCAGYSVLSVPVNAASRSRRERALWTPACVVLAALSVTAVRSSPRAAAS
jgi:hypothetical protein